MAWSFWQDSERMNDPIWGGERGPLLGAGGWVGRRLKLGWPRRSLLQFRLFSLRTSQGAAGTAVLCCNAAYFRHARAKGPLAPPFFASIPPIFTTEPPRKR